MRELLARNVPLYRLYDESDLGPLCRRLGIEVVHSCHTTTDLLVSRCLSNLPSDQRPQHVVTLHGGYETLALEPLLYHLNQVQAVDQFVYTATKNLTSFPKQFLARCRFARIVNALPMAPRSAEIGVTSEWREGRGRSHADLASHSWQGMAAGRRGRRGCTRGVGARYPSRVDRERAGLR